MGSHRQGGDDMSDEINIQFTRFSAFYSPLIATIAGGFLSFMRAKRHRYEDVVAAPPAA
jgi:hypothetical protein